MNKKYIVGGMVCLAAVVAVVLMIGANKRVKIMDCIEVETVGYDGSGSASAHIDEDKFFEAIGKANKELKDLDDSGYTMSSLNDALVMEELLCAVDFTVTPSENLSNGDKIVVTAEFDEDIAEKYDIKFTDLEAEFEVKGLE